MRAVVWLLAICFALPTALPAQSSPPTADVPVLSPGDAIRITVWRKPELGGEFKVAADGAIADPFYMDLRVAAVPFPLAAEQVRSHIAKYEVEPRVYVEPLFRISVGGEVRQPNLYMLRPETTIEQAVMEAGGPTERGRRDRVRLRRGEQELNIDLTDSRDDRARMPIRSGDQILIGRQPSVVRDYVAPFSSILSAVVSLAYAATRYF
jgi:protein involved in polysaccharide export with SLBB domain